MTAQPRVPDLHQRTPARCFRQIPAHGIEQRAIALSQPRTKGFHPCQYADEFDGRYLYYSQVRDGISAGFRGLRSARRGPARRRCKYYPRPYGPCYLEIRQQNSINAMHSGIPGAIIRSRTHQLLEHEFVRDRKA